MATVKKKLTTIKESPKVKGSQKRKYSIDTDSIRPAKRWRTETTRTVFFTSEKMYVKSQLYRKYVPSGEWNRLNDDDRQDASLLEKMLYAKQQPDYEVYTPDETKAYYEQLKKELNAV